MACGNKLEVLGVGRARAADLKGGRVRYGEWEIHELPAEGMDLLKIDVDLLRANLDTIRRRNDCMPSVTIIDLNFQIFRHDLRRMAVIFGG